jgi:hypothetical protein
MDSPPPPLVHSSSGMDLLHDNASMDDAILHETITASMDDAILHETITYLVYLE